MKIKYDGSYPNLCSGNLIVIIDGKEWSFPDHCLSSGGSAGFDADWDSVVTSGEWSIDSWPANFPEELKESVEDAVNCKISHGCCGGCL